MSENSEQYKIRINGQSGHVIETTSSEPSATLNAADVALLGPSAFVEVRQLSNAVGPGAALTRTITLP